MRQGTRSRGRAIPAQVIIDDDLARITASSARCGHGGRLLALQADKRWNASALDSEDVLIGPELLFLSRDETISMGTESLARKGLNSSLSPYEVVEGKCWEPYLMWMNVFKFTYEFTVNCQDTWTDTRDEYLTSVSIGPKQTRCSCSYRYYISSLSSIKNGTRHQALVCLCHVQTSQLHNLYMPQTLAGLAFVLSQHEHVCTHKWQVSICIHNFISTRNKLQKNLGRFDIEWISVTAMAFMA